MTRYAKVPLRIGLLSGILLAGITGTSWGLSDMWLVYVGNEVLDSSIIRPNKIHAAYYGHVKGENGLSVCDVLRQLTNSLSQSHSNSNFNILSLTCTNPKITYADSETDTNKNPKLKLESGYPSVTRNHNTYVLYVFRHNKPLACRKKAIDSVAIDAPIVPETPVTVRKPPSSLLGETADKQVELLPKNWYFYLCDLGTHEIGSKRITYTIGTPEPNAVPILNNDEQPQIKEVIFQASIEVHELYRFRITAGPVYSSLIDKNRTNFQRQTNSGGQTVITSDTANDAPVNYPIFLKIYLHPDGRDVLYNPPWLPITTKSFAKFLKDPINTNFFHRVSGIIGINLVDEPQNNFYIGLGFEPALGVDIIGGVHVGKITALRGGFTEGQILTTETPITKDIFQTGYFAGVMVDVGVIGAWLGNTLFSTTQGVFNAVRGPAPAPVPKS